MNIRHNVGMNRQIFYFNHETQNYEILCIIVNLVVIRLQLELFAINPIPTPFQINV